jgi:hypothetical protein
MFSDANKFIRVMENPKIARENYRRALATKMLLRGDPPASGIVFLVREK